MQRSFSQIFSRIINKGRHSAVPCRCFGQPVSQTHPHLLTEGEVTPGLSQNEFHKRRHNLMSLIARQHAKKDTSSQSERHIVIIPAAPRVYMTHDIPYPFHQNTDFLYLSGFLEPNSVLILEGYTSSLPDYKSLLFVPKKDPLRELWDGPRSGIDGALQLTGVDDTDNIDNLGHYLKCYNKDNSNFLTWYNYRSPPHKEFHDSHISQFLKDNVYGFIENPKPLLHALRVVKSPAEQKLMQKSADIASEAFMDVMRTSKPGMNESELYAKMDYECRTNGADILAYPPVVAGGNRANTIHYVSNNQVIEDGEMVLMDAGCECHGYSSDITRTWPINGEYSGAQLELYEALLEVQEQCIQLCRHQSITMEGIFLDMLSLLGVQLQRLSIVPPDTQGMELQRIAREFCPHHVSHYLGMDVHDTDSMPRAVPLVSGMCLTIEPGLYIPENRTDVPREFRGIGIRIEDDILITENGPVNLTINCPKCPDDIETVMSDGKK